MVKTYIDVRNEAVRQIEAAFTDGGGKCRLHVGAHPGRFDEAEIRRLAQQSPAILTSLMRIDDESNEAGFISWVLARAQGRDKLYDAALGFVSALVPVIRGLDADFSMDAPHDIEAECLYSGSLDAVNVTLWAVGWTWKLQKSVLEEGEGGFPVCDPDWFESYGAETKTGPQTIRDDVHLEGNHGNTDGANS
jgi:hypothetical protein